MNILKVTFGFLLLCLIFVFTPFFKMITWVGIQFISFITWFGMGTLALMIGAYFQLRKLFRKNEKNTFQKPSTPHYSITQ
ncbi:hypothetical protein AVL50_20430 [Flammeovirga sp. SJP92]|nr:hypothetical protein AVL50_20430 [Flammeovirga sp. SJP92]